MQIIVRKLAGNHPYIRVAAGTFRTCKSTKLTGKFKKNAYTFGGTYGTSKRMSKKEKAVATLIIAGWSRLEAYFDVYPTAINRNRADARVNLILGKESVMNFMQKKVEAAAERSGATLPWALGVIKTAVDDSQDAAVKIRGAGVIVDLHTREKDTGVPTEAGVFAGFTDPLLPEYAPPQLGPGPGAGPGPPVSVQGPGPPPPPNGVPTGPPIAPDPLGPPVPDPLGTPQHR